MSKRIAAAMAVLIAIVGMVVIIDHFNQPPVELIKVSLGAEVSLLSSAVWVAENQGYFKDEGLDIEIRDFQSGRQSFENMLGEDGVDISTVAPTPIMFKSFDQQDFSILATFVYSYDDVKVIARRDAGIEVAADLQGHRIGTPKGTTGQFFVDAFLVENRISEAEVVDIPPEELPHALLDGRVEAIVIWEPHAIKARRLLGDNAVRLPSSGIYKETFNFMVKNDFAKKNPELLRSFIRAIDRANRFINTNSEQAKTITAERLGLKREDVAQLWDEFIFQLSLDQALVTVLEAEARWAIKEQLVTGQDVPDYMNFIYAKALEQEIPYAVNLYTQPRDKVVIATTAHPAAGVIHVALVNRFFRQEGINVVRQTYTSGKACLNAVLAGKADIATVADTPIMHAGMNSRNILILATIMQSRKNKAIVAKGSLGITAVKDLQGKRIGVTLGTNSEFFLDTFLLYHGVPTSSIEFIDTKPEEMHSVLIADHVDAVATWHPHVNRLMKSLGDDAMIFYGEEIYTETFNLVAMRNFVDNGKAVVVQLLEALVLADEQIRNDPEKSSTHIAASIGMRNADLKELWPIYDFTLKLDQALPLTLRDQARWIISKKQLNREPPDYTRLIYQDGLRQIKPGAFGPIK